MGVREDGARFAAVTNVRDPFDLRPKEPGEASRGDIVRGALIEDVGAMAYAARVASANMRGFNLLALDDDALVWCSNRGGALPKRLTRGVHGLSNAAIDTPWPKVEAPRRCSLPRSRRNHRSKGSSESWPTTPGRPIRRCPIPASASRSSASSRRFGNHDADLRNALRHRC